MPDRAAAPGSASWRVAATVGARALRALVRFTPWLAGYAAPAACLVLAAGFAVIAAGQISSRPMPVHDRREIAAVSLTTDRRGALFDESDLAPGQTVTRCLVVSYSGPAQDLAVRLAAEEVTGPLLPALNMVVRVGAGGSDDSCAGFTGTTIFDGPLTGLSTESAAGVGVSTAWRPAGTSSRTFAFTVRVDEDAVQAASATARFRWLLNIPDEPEPPVQETPGAQAAAAEPSAEPGTDTDTEVEAAAPSATPAGAAAVDPDTDIRHQTHHAKAGRPASRPAEHGPAESKGWTGKVAEAAVVVQRIAVKASRHTAVPLVSLAIVLIFLAVQERIDRRDPKLADAPVTRDRYAYFPADGRSGK